MSVVHTTRLRIEKHQGPHRSARVEHFTEPFHFGMHGGVKAHYEAKLGPKFGGADYPTSLDYVIMGVSSCLAGTFAASLEARKVAVTDRLKTDVEGTIEEVDGVMKITKIHLRYRLEGEVEKDVADRALASHARSCPAYQSVKDSITCTWEFEAG